ncbi:hypothetical protein GQ607_011727 [Colletotrichum asianum]|uniref:Uncharacterized protein n=1 Tax=Colletotrichum asianum TaxID=702518 RepID=A0A8H3W783_9PEZI|nr:hypothetical protein GQ607_011727 [Colletotrichum asianum]
MPPQPRFLSLPREIRDIIYKFYVVAEGGYTCNPEKLVEKILNQHSDETDSASLDVSGILQRADLQPIDLNLSYTCKLVAQEMSGVALRTNAVTFSTFTSAELRILAARFHSLMVGRFDGDRRGLLKFAGHAISAEACRQLKVKFPQFSQLLDRMVRQGRAHHTWGAYGEVPSVYRAFQKDALLAIARSETGRKRLDRYWYENHERWAPHIPPLLVVRCNIEHWAIPSMQDMQYLSSCQMEDSDFVSMVTRLRDRTNYRFSAAAAAIHVLQSLPSTIRKQLRRVVLEEDREAVADPQCHALGLIPLCQENPLLRVERRVNLWRNAFQRDGYYRWSPESRYKAKYRHVPWAMDSNLETLWAMDSAQVTANVSSWVGEALALEPAGMPPGAFSLVLEGEPVPWQSTQVFQRIIQRDAAWQEAWNQSLDRGILPALSWFGRKGESWGHPAPDWAFDNWPQALRDIAEGTSVVKCNFDVGDPWSVEQIVDEHRGWTMNQWTEELERPEPLAWEPDAPLPGWKEIIEEDLVYVEPEDDVSSANSDDETYSDEDDS